MSQRTPRTCSDNDDTLSTIAPLAARSTNGWWLHSLHTSRFKQWIARIEWRDLSRLHRQINDIFQLPLVTIPIWHHRHAIISRDNLSKVRTLNRYSPQLSDKLPQHGTCFWQLMTSWQDIWENTHRWDNGKPTLMFRTRRCNEKSEDRATFRRIFFYTRRTHFSIDSNLEVVGVWTIT